MRSSAETWAAEYVDVREGDVVPRGMATRAMYVGWLVTAVLIAVVGAGAVKQMPTYSSGYAAAVRLPWDRQQQSRMAVVLPISDQRRVRVGQEVIVRVPDGPQVASLTVTAVAPPRTQLPEPLRTAVGPTAASSVAFVLAEDTGRDGVDLGRTIYQAHVATGSRALLSFFPWRSADAG